MKVTPAKQMLPMNKVGVTKSDIMFPIKILRNFEKTPITKFFNSKWAGTEEFLDEQIKQKYDELEELKNLQKLSMIYTILYVIYSLKTVSFSELKDVLNITHNEILSRALNRLQSAKLIQTSTSSSNPDIIALMELKLWRNKRTLKYYSITDSNLKLITNDNIKAVERIISDPIKNAVTMISSFYTRHFDNLAEHRRQEAEYKKRKLRSKMSNFNKIHSHIVDELHIKKGESVSAQTLLMSLTFVNNIFSSRKIAKTAIENLLILSYLRRGFDNKNQEILFFVDRDEEVIKKLKEEKKIY